MAIFVLMTTTMMTQPITFNYPCTSCMVINLARDKVTCVSPINTTNMQCPMYALSPTPPPPSLSGKFIQYYTITNSIIHGYIQTI